MALHKFISDIYSASNRLIGTQLSKLVLQKDLNKIYDFISTGILLNTVEVEKDDFLALEKDYLKKAEDNCSYSSIVKCTEKFRSIVSLKRGESCRLAKELSGLPRTINIIRKNTGEYALIVETKSKLSTHDKLSPHKKILPLKAGSFKRGKPAWQVIPVEKEYFNLVVNRDIDAAKKEVQISQDIDSPYVVQFEIGEEYTDKKGNKKLNIYSARANDSLGSILYDLKAKKNPLSEEEQDRLVLEMLLGIKAMHDKDWVHQDIKPDNILVDGSQKSEFHLRIGDFGLSRKNGIGSICGTSTYMSPEMIANWSLSATTFRGRRYVIDADKPHKANDIWAVGMVAFMIRNNRVKPTAADITEIDKDPLLKGLLDPERATRFTVEQAIAIHQDIMNKKAALKAPVKVPTPVKAISPVKAPIVPAFALQKAPIKAGVPFTQAEKIEFVLKHFSIIEMLLEKLISKELIEEIKIIFKHEANKIPGQKPVETAKVLKIIQALKNQQAKAMALK